MQNFDVLMLCIPELSYNSDTVNRLAAAIGCSTPLFFTDETNLDELLAKSTQIIIPLMSSKADQTSLTIPTAVLSLLKKMSKSGKKSQEVFFLIGGSGCEETTKKDFDLLHCAGVWGLVRSARIEMPHTKLFCIDSDEWNSDGDFQLLARQVNNELSLAGVDSFEVAYRKNSRFAPMLDLLSPLSSLPDICSPLLANSSKNSPPSPNNQLQEGVVLITGGLGGLGLVSAEALVECGAKLIILVSRSGTVKRSGQGLEDRLESLQNLKGVKIVLEKCDMSVESEVEQLLVRVRNLGTIKVIIHAAGVLSDALMINQTEESMKKVWGAKADGAWFLHKHTVKTDKELKSFILFSSVASLVGNIGQINYSAANGFLDSLVQWRRSQGLPGLSIQWPGVSGIGLAASLDKNMDHESSTSLVAVKKILSIAHNS